MNNGHTYIDRIGNAHDGLPVIEYYALRHPHFTREEWLARIEAGMITCSDRALAPHDIVSSGSTLEYFRQPWEEPDVTNEIPVLLDNRHIVVFDKPDGMPVLPGGMYLENAMVSIVRRTVDPMLSPLHRLGRGTTGAIIFTRTTAAAAAFSRMMRRHEIDKTYLALVHGCGIPDAFVIDVPIGRVSHPRLGEIHDVTPTGKPSISACTTLARNGQEDSSLVLVTIPTGRTHQIRIHLAWARHPLVGDRFYLGLDRVESSNVPSSLPGDPGYILHAWKVRFISPFSGKERTIIAPVRREIVEWCARTGCDLPYHDCVAD